MFENIQISAKILALIAEVDEWKGEWKHAKNLDSNQLLALQHVATIESAGASTRIEGSVLNDEAIQHIYQNIGNENWATRDEQEVVGYIQTIEIILQNVAHIGITENNIKQLHAALLKHASKDQWHRGNYKTLDNHVVATDANGKTIEVVFATASILETPQRMQDLCKWLNHAVEHKMHHVLIIIALFVIEFLAIHPFQDGNGRLSRLLTTLLLLQNGYSYTHYASLEAIVEQNKKSYYASLRATQATMKTNTIDWLPWLEFFTGIMQKQVFKVQRKLASLKPISKPQDEKIIPAAIADKKAEAKQVEVNDTIDLRILPKLSQNIIKLITQEGIATNQDIVKFTKQNRNTIKKHLQNLVRLQLIKQHGVGKGSRYTL